VVYGNIVSNLKACGFEFMLLGVYENNISSLRQAVFSFWGLLSRFLAEGAPIHAEVTSRGAVLVAFKR